jgi:asparagine N-glycosylation enzyme membrane subunit Stt3
MTKPLKTYGWLSIAWVIVYCAALYPAVHQKPLNTATVSSLAVLFTLLLTSVEGACLKHEDATSTRGNIRFQYSLISVVASTLAAAVWMLVWQHNALLFVATEVIIAALLIGTALTVDRKRIKGIAKHKLFQ